jgi:arylsulfatase
MLLATAVLSTTQLNAQDRVGSVLPFPPTPMDSVAKPRLQDSTMKWPQQPQRLPADAPNILIVLLDDTGFGVSETFGAITDPVPKVKTVQSVNC